jgi:hypothetical protein
MRVPRFFKAWAAASQPPALGVHIYVPDLAEKSGNQVQNFQNDRLRVTQVIFGPSERLRSGVRRHSDGGGRHLTLAASRLSCRH